MLISECQINVESQIVCLISTAVKKCKEACEEQVSGEKREAEHTLERRDEHLREV